MESARLAVQCGKHLFTDNCHFRAEFSKHLQRRGVLLDGELKELAMSTPIVEGGGRAQQLSPTSVVEGTIREQTQRLQQVRTALCNKCKYMIITSCLSSTLSCSTCHYTVLVCVCVCVCDIRSQIKESTLSLRLPHLCCRCP